jgi:Lrp/AsnC family leucine-responsive transcriptional regulator
LLPFISTESLKTRLNRVVEIKMKLDHQALSREFINIVAAVPEVKQCYYVTGDVDFVLIVNIVDIFEYEAFCDPVLYKHSNLHKFTTLVSMKCTKFDTY